MIYNNSVTDNISLNTLRNIINTSNLMSDDIIIGLINAIKLCRTNVIQRSIIKIKKKMI